jgi:hypothetical protein
LFDPFQRWYEEENFQEGKQSASMANLTYAFKNTVVELSFLFNSGAKCSQNVLIKIKKEFLPYESEDELFNEFTDDEKDEIFRIIFGESNEEPSVDKEKWRKYSEMSNRNDENYNVWYENCIAELKLSATDIRNGLFADKVIDYIADICKKDKDAWEFPTRKMLAYG